jgi:hypothetical protein
MSSSQSFQQAPHKLLVIPGPIEVDDKILYANASPSVSHVSPAFIPIFGDCLRMLRKVLYAEKTGQPFMIAGSGTLGWDQAAANLVEPGEECVSISCCFSSSSPILSSARSIAQAAWPLCVHRTFCWPPPAQSFGADNPVAENPDSKT